MLSTCLHVGFAAGFSELKRDDLRPCKVKKMKNDVSTDTRTLAGLLAQLLINNYRSSLIGETYHVVNCSTDIFLATQWVKLNGSQ